MPQIPVYDATKTLAVVRPTARAPVPKVSVGAAGITGRALAQVGTVMARVGEKLYQVRVDQEFSQASLGADRDLRQTEYEASQDPNIQDWDARYGKKLQDVRAKWLKTIKTPLARTKFQNVFDRDSLDSQYRIKNLGNKLLVDQSLATLEEEKAQFAQGYYQATTPQEKQKLVDKMASRFGFRADTGVMTKQKAAADFKGWKDMLITGQAEYDIQISPSLVVEKLDNGLYGLKTTNPKEWARLREKASKKIERDIKIAETLRDEKWLKKGGEMIADLETVSVEDIIRAITADEISPDLGNDLIKWKTDPETAQYETDKKIWLEIARDSVNPELDLRNFQNAIAKAVANKSIQATEAAELSVQVQELFKDAIAFKSGPNRFHRLIGAAMDMFTKWAEAVTPGNPVAAAFLMTKELVKKIRGGQIIEANIEEEGRKIVNEQNKELNPSVGAAKKEGQLMIDADGNKAIVFPDGSYKEVE